MKLSEWIATKDLRNSCVEAGEARHLQVEVRKLEDELEAIRAARRVATGLLKARKAQVASLLAAWYECPQDSVPDVLQGVFIELEALDADSSL